MKEDENNYKRELIHWHLSDDNKIAYRIPNKVNSFKMFRNKKSCKVKDYSIEVVTKMYRLHNVNLKELKEEMGL
jgi:hypothetical protein